MTLKDWRRQSGNKIIYEHRWKKLRIGVFQNLKKTYNVVLIKSINDNKILSKAYKTKKQALVFAKVYMSKH